MGEIADSIYTYSKLSNYNGIINKSRHPFTLTSEEIKAIYNYFIQKKQ